MMLNLLHTVVPHHPSVLILAMLFLSCIAFKQGRYCMDPANIESKHLGA